MVTVLNTEKMNSILKRKEAMVNLDEDFGLFMEMGSAFEPATGGMHDIIVDSL
jgi:hypothetical protein